MASFKPIPYWAILLTNEELALLQQCVHWGIQLLPCGKYVASQEKVCEALDGLLNKLTVAASEKPAMELRAGPDGVDGIECNVTP